MRWVTVMAWNKLPLIFLLLLLFTFLPFCFAAPMERASEAQSPPNVDSHDSLPPPNMLSLQNQSLRRTPLGISPSSEASFFGETLFKGLGYSLAAGLLAISLLKRFSGAKAKGQESEVILIRGRKYLGPKTALFVAEVDDRQFFLAQCGDDIKLLSLIDTSAGREKTLREFFEASTLAEQEMEEAKLVNGRQRL